MKYTHTLEHNLKISSSKRKLSVDIPTNIKKCIIWKGAVNNKGYGVVNYKGKYWLVHRLIYTLHNPEIDINRMLVLHKCDIRNCINPNHLFIGTAKDNTNDMIDKDRMKHANGENAGKSKLTWKKVEKIRNKHGKKHVTTKKLSEKYGVSCMSIRNIVNKKTWRK